MLMQLASEWVVHARGTALVDPSVWVLEAEADPADRPRCGLAVHERGVLAAWHCWVVPVQIASISSSGFKDFFDPEAAAIPICQRVIVSIVP